MFGYRKVMALTVMCLLTVLGQVDVKGAMTIDDFSEPDPAVATFINLFHPDPTLIKTAHAGIVGGERDLLLDVIGIAGPISYGGLIGAGSMSFSTGGASGTTAILQYDGADADIVGPPAFLIDAQGLGGIDLTAAGDGFYFDFGLLDSGVAPTTGIDISVTAPAQPTALFSGQITESLVPFTFFVPFSDFSSIAALQQATSITIQMNPFAVTGVDFVLDRIHLDTQPIPAPAAVFLCGIGVGFVSWLRRRRSL